jgi:hypothetical protein
VLDVRPFRSYLRNGRLLVPKKAPDTADEIDCRSTVMGEGAFRAASVSALLSRHQGIAASGDGIGDHRFVEQAGCAST